MSGLDGLLSEAERRLYDHALKNDGTVFDRRALSNEDVLMGGAWDPGRTVRAVVLVRLLTEIAAPGQQQPRTLRLAGVRIAGILDLEALILLRPLVLTACFLDGPVSLEQAQVPRLELTRCVVPAVNARQVEVHGDLRLEALQGVTSIRLEASRIGGSLSLRGTRISGRDASLDADLLDVRGDASCDGLEVDGCVRLTSAHIGGQLVLNGARLRSPDGLALDGERLRIDGNMICELDGPRPFRTFGELRIASAQIAGYLSFRGARMCNPGRCVIDANGLSVDGGLVCQPFDAHRFEADGEIRLIDGRAGGIDMSGALLRNLGRIALDAERLQVRGSMLCESRGALRFLSYGEIRIPGGQIDGQLSFAGARLYNPEGDAFYADGLRVEGDMFLQKLGAHAFEADGQVRLFGAAVAGQLSFGGAQLRNATGTALAANGVRVGGSMLCDTVDAHAFEANGAVLLTGARIGGILSLRGATVNGEGRTLSLEAVTARELWLPDQAAVSACVDLSASAVGQFSDGWQAGSKSAYAHRIAGFSYQTLASRSDDALGSDGSVARLDWLSRAEEGFLPHGYDQLIKVYRGLGRDEDVRTVAIAKERARRATMSAPGKVASFLAEKCVGYGYKTQRAVYALVAIILTGALIDGVGYPRHFRPLRAPGQLPQFHSWLYALDTVLPVVNLGQKAAWAPTGFWSYWCAFSVIAGWLLGLGFVGYLSAALFRE